MARTRISIAKPDIVRLFEASDGRVFRRSELGEMLEKNRGFWRLAQSETVASFVDFLTKRTSLRREVLDFPHRKEVRYTWGEVPIFELLQAAKPDAYFTYFTALYMHELTDQIPKTIYVLLRHGIIEHI